MTSQLPTSLLPSPSSSSSLSLRSSLLSSLRSSSSLSLLRSPSSWSLSSLWMLLLALLLVLQPISASSYTDEGLYGWGDGYACEITETVVSPYMSPQYEMSMEIRGCVSQEQSLVNRFIYVINIARSNSNRGRRGDGEEEERNVGGRGVEKQVDLYISPVNAAGHDEPMIFVLNSWQPTLWRIHTQSISNTTRNLFWLPDHSRLSTSSNVNIRVKKFTELSSLSGQSLESWVRQRPRTGGCITMFAELRGATKFFVQVGDDQAAPRSCVIQRNLQSTTVQAYQLHPQPAGGCYQPRNEGVHGENVHIIELSGGPEPASPLAINAATVEVDIGRRQDGEEGGAQNGGGLNKNVLLVLHAPYPVRWRVRSQGVRGKLTVVLQQDHRINTEEATTMAAVNVIYERLGGRLRKDALLDWVTEKYGPPVSYTNVPLANRFTLVVDGADELPVVGALPHSGNPQLPNEISPFSHPEKTQVAIIDNKHISCLMDDMVIALDKQILQVYGVQKSQLTLLDSKCVAAENRTHYILSTSLSDCGTYKEEHNGIRFFKNAIVVRSASATEETVVKERTRRRSPHRRRSRHGDDGADKDLTNADSTNNDSDADLEEDEEGSGSGLMMRMVADDTHFDDEDYVPLTQRGNRAESGGSTIQVDLECEYSMGEIVNIKVLPDSLEGVRFQLRLFTDDRYFIEEHSFPLVMKEKQKMYIEASVEGDDRLGVMVYSCWLSENPVASWSKAQTFHKYIDRGCGHDQSFEHITTMTENTPLPANIRRFSFDYRYDYGDNLDSSYLQCRLEPCLRKGELPIEGARLSVCAPNAYYCMQHNLLSSSIPKPKPFRQLVFLGELHSPVDHHTGGEKVVAGSTAQDRPCSTITRMEGLESGAVVGIAFAAFIIGVALTMALWGIHHKTSKGTMQLRAAHRTMRSNETSGESTPSSTAPITIHQVNPH